MSSFCLYLTACDHGVSLEATEFQNDETSTVLRCQRGTNTFRQGSGTFTWSQGVQALVQLFLEVKIASLDSRQGSILGERGSLAASLDYSVAKNGLWLADMFGVYSDGTLRARRILRRTNPERKRPGPVEIFLNTAIISPKEVIILCDGKSMETKDELVALQKLLPASTTAATVAVGNSWKRTSQVLCDKGEPSRQNREANPNQDGWLVKVLEQELSNAITSTDIFTARALRKTLSNIFEDPYLSKHLPKTGGAFLWEQSSPLPRSALLGLRQPERSQITQQLSRLTIATPVFLSGAIGLFMYLKQKGLITVDIDYCFYRSSEILIEARGDKDRALPDGFVCSAASFPEMLKSAKKLDYVPLMLLPGVSSRVVSGGPQHSEVLQPRVCQEILVIGDQPTSGSIYAHKLARSRSIGQRPIKIRSVDARCFEDSAPPHNDEFALVLGFPTYHYHHHVNQSSFLDTPKDSENTLETILFIKQSMVLDGTAALLDMLIRDAWLEIQENPAALARLATLISTDSLYVKTLKRFGGFYKSARALVKAG